MSRPESVTPGKFFRSRWVEPPGGAMQLDREVLPAGFRAAGVAAGIKRSGDLDVGLLVCDAEDAVSAARFTRNAVVAAPVIVSRRAKLDRLRAVAVNSGNANVSTGEAGLEIAAEMGTTAARGLGLATERAAVASTGVIGVGLDRTPLLAGIEAALGALTESAGDFARAIMTTDRWSKYATLELALAGGPVRLAAQAKGGGMIAPSFATMLAFIETDAAVDPQTLARLLGAATEHSFERISVDGQLSTNDSVFMFASGSAGLAVEPGSDDERLFAGALDALLKQLALEVVADGEGAIRVARLVVRGGSGSTEPVARAIANSPLVRCALYGGDPNWGRIVQAGGQALLDAGSVAFDVAIEDVEVAREGVALELGGAARSRLADAMQAAEVELTLSFGSGDEESEIFFCDLGPEYVRVNSEYS